jgi:hypothetical protein
MDTEDRKDIAPPLNSGGADSVLASLFRSILLDLGINWGRFDALLSEYVGRNLQTEGNKDKSSQRGNLKRELLGDSVTWKVFCKGLKFLHVWKFQITIHAHHENGKITVHSKTVQILQPPVSLRSREDSDDKTEEIN